VAGDGKAFPFTGFRTGEDALGIAASDAPLMGLPSLQSIEMRAVACLLVCLRSPSGPLEPSGCSGPHRDGRIFRSARHPLVGFHSPPGSSPRLRRGGRTDPPLPVLGFPASQAPAGAVGIHPGLPHPAHPLPGFRPSQRFFPATPPPPVKTESASQAFHFQGIPLPKGRYRFRDPLPSCGLAFPARIPETARPPPLQGFLPPGSPFDPPVV